MAVGEGDHRMQETTVRHHTSCRLRQFHPKGSLPHQPTDPASITSLPVSEKLRKIAPRCSPAGDHHPDRRVAFRVRDNLHWGRQAPFDPSAQRGPVWCSRPPSSRAAGPGKFLTALRISVHSGILWIRTPSCGPKKPGSISATDKVTLCQT